MSNRIMLDAKLCRTCQKAVDKKDGHSKLDEVDPGTEITLRTKLHVCVPEMMLGDSNEDVICMICTNMLNLSYMFRNVCIKTEQARNDTLPTDFICKVKKEIVPDDTGIIVTRLQTPTAKSDKKSPTKSPKSRRNSRNSPSASAASRAPTAKDIWDEYHQSSENLNLGKKGRCVLSEKRRGNHDRSRVSAEDMNGGLDDGNNQEPLLEIAYEEPVGDSDTERLSTTSYYSIGSLRDVPEVIVRDPNTNTAPGARMLRTRQNVSYAMPPDSPETVQKPSSAPQRSAPVVAAAVVTAGVEPPNASAVVKSRLSMNAVGPHTEGRRNAVGSEGGEAKSKGQHKSRQQSNTNLSDVDVIDDFCRRNDRDPLEFLCTIPMLKCDVDIGHSAPLTGVIPCIDKLQCDMCGHQLSTFVTLRRHRMRHFCNFNIRCTICGSRAYERYVMREHLELRHNVKRSMIDKYIENSPQDNPDSTPLYRFIGPRAAPAATIIHEHTKTSLKRRSRTSTIPNNNNKTAVPRPPQSTLPTRNKPGPKSSKLTTIINKPVPKSKVASQNSAPATAANNKPPGPNSSNAPPVTEVVNSNSMALRTLKSPPKVGGNVKSGSAHPELKRRLSVEQNQVVNVKKRKQVPPSNTASSARFKYECAICDVLVSDQETLRTHLKSYHCNICYKLFVGKSSSKAHHCLHVPQKINDEIYFRCLDCDDYKSKAHFLTHLPPYKRQKLDHLFTVYPRATYDSFNADEKRRIVPIVKCNLGKSNQECFFFCGDPDALKFHQVRVHSLTKLLQQISQEKLNLFEQLDKQIRPVKIQTQAGNTAKSLSASLQDMQMINYIEDFVDVDALEAPDSMGNTVIERCATCDEEIPTGPLEHECIIKAADANVIAEHSNPPPPPPDELYKCEICLNSFDRLSLIDHMKVHMNITVM